MAKREDGRQTRRKLLNAACEVFARKGFQGATVAEICRQAGTNVASVNYYFGDKASLYQEAWQHGLKRFTATPLAESSAGPPRELLKRYVERLLRHFAARDDLGQVSRLYLMELVNPTGLIEEAWYEIIEPQRRALHKIIGDIMGPEADQTSILFCELSIINQCRVLVTTKRSDLQYILGLPLSPELVERLARHIAEFSLAGIQAVGARTG